MENKTSYEIIARQFSLEGSFTGLDTDSAYYKALQKALSEKIKFFIRTDLDKLLQILYRIDVPQQESDNAFEKGEINAISDDLAYGIILRQLKKKEYAKSFNKRG